LYLLSILLSVVSSSSSTDIWTIIGDGGYLFGIVVIAIGGFFLYKSAVAKENNELKNDLIDTQRKTIDELKESVQALVKRDDEQQKMIDNLKTDLDSWKNQPIKQLSDNYAQMSETMLEMKELLKELVEENRGGRLRKSATKRSS
jgi:uncharacterized phage infection (PIP) family protein YhgE